MAASRRIGWGGWSVAILLVMAVTLIGIIRLGNKGGDGSAVPSGKDCPTSHLVKGNIAQDGDMIYHLSGWRYYDSTYPEKCVKTSNDAVDAGFRPSKVQ